METGEGMQVMGIKKGVGLKGIKCRTGNREVNGNNENRGRTRER